MMKTFSQNYLNLLQGEFKGINLTRIDDPDEFYNKQIIDSVLPLEKSSIFLQEINKSGILVDVGFGGGFPIFPLAVKLPGIKFIGLDARSKKVEVVTAIGNMLEIKNSKLHHIRVEEVVFDLPVVITFKAVGKISDLLSSIKSSTRVLVCFYKGPNVHELENIKSALKSWDLKEEIQYEVPGTEGRSFLCFRNKNVLRGTIDSKLIKISELL